MRNIEPEKMTKNERLTYYEGKIKELEATTKKYKIWTYVLLCVSLLALLLEPVRAEEIEQCDENGNCWIIVIEDEDTETETESERETEEVTYIVEEDTESNSGESGSTSDTGMVTGSNVQTIKDDDTDEIKGKTVETVENTLEDVKGLKTANTGLLGATYTATTADNPATPQLWRGLNADRTIYIYSITLSDGTKLYSGSNTGSLRVYRNSDDPSNYMRVENAYCKDGEQQPTIWYDDINKARSLTWGYSTVSYITRNAPAWGGQGGWGTYSFYTIQYPETPTQTEVQGTLVGTLTKYWITDNGDPRAGSATEWNAGSMQLEKTITAGSAATLNGIYVTTSAVLALLIFTTFKRGR